MSRRRYYRVDGSEVTVNHNSNWGCLALIVTCIFLWGACFGVTYDGKHYELSCSCADGVTIEK